MDEQQNESLMTEMDEHLEMAFSVMHDSVHRVRFISETLLHLKQCIQEESAEDVERYLETALTMTEMTSGALQGASDHIRPLLDELDQHWERENVNTPLV